MTISASSVYEVILRLLNMLEVEVITGWVYGDIEYGICDNLNQMYDNMDIVRNEIGSVLCLVLDVSTI